MAPSTSGFGKGMTYLKKRFKVCVIIVVIITWTGEKYQLQNEHYITAIRVADSSNGTLSVFFLLSVLSTMKIKWHPYEHQRWPVAFLSNVRGGIKRFQTISSLNAAI